MSHTNRSLTVAAPTGAAPRLDCFLRLGRAFREYGRGGHGLTRMRQAVASALRAADYGSSRLSATVVHLRNHGRADRQTVPLLLVHPDVS